MNWDIDHLVDPITQLDAANKQLLEGGLETVHGITNIRTRLSIALAQVQQLDDALEAEQEKLLHSYDVSIKAAAARQAARQADGDWYENDEPLA